MADGALVRFALCQGSLQQVQKLFNSSQQHHADIPMADGQLPLHVAVDADRPEIVILLNHGAHVNKTDSAGWTALHHAVYKGNIHLVKILLNHGADPSLRAGNLLPIDLAMDFDNGMTKLLRDASTTWCARLGKLEPVSPSKRVSGKRKGSDLSHWVDAIVLSRPIEKDAKENAPKTIVKRTASLFK